MRFIIIITLLSCCTMSCKRFSEGSDAKAKRITRTVAPTCETQRFDEPTTADAADDPCIWYNEKHPEQSLILGTNKKGGLGVFSLKGEMLHYLPVGKVNNVDIRYHYQYKGTEYAIAAASNRSTNGLSFFLIDSLGTLNEVKAKPYVSNIKKVYGFCLAHYQNKLYAFVNSKEGEVEQVLVKQTNGEIELELERYWSVGSQTEGMVSDDRTQTLYLGVEEVGIYKYSLDPNSSTQINMITGSSTKTNKNIDFDIEGLTIYCTNEHDGYLIASSQGNYSYAVFERQNQNKYLGSFRIVGDSVDSVEETDGIDVINLGLNNTFPNGMFVVQDGYNKDNGKDVAQNFKLVSWDDIAASFSPALNINNTYIPTQLK